MKRPDEEVWVQPCSMVPRPCGAFRGASSSTNPVPPTGPPQPVIPTTSTTGTTGTVTVGAVYFPNLNNPPGAVYNSAAATANSSLFTASLWARIPDGSINNKDNNLLSFTIPGLFGDFSLVIKVGFNFNYDVYVVAAFGSPLVYSFDSFDGVFSANATGHHIFVSLDTNHPAGAKIGNIFVDGINVADPTDVYDVFPAFAIPFNGLEFGTPTPNDPAATPLSITDTELTEVWVAPGVYLDPTTYLSKFRDPVTGLPVPLGAQGELPTGTPPTYYLTGSAASYPINRSGGPPVSQTGTIVDGTFNTFLDQNPLTVFLANALGDSYSGVFQDPMTVADSPFITISMWVRAQNNGLNNLHTAPNLVSPGLGSNSIDLGGSLDGSQGDQDISCYFAATTLPGTHQVAFGSTSRPFTMNDTGHHVFISIDTNHPAGAKLLNVYIDAVNVKDNSITLDANVAFNIGFNGFKFGLPDTDDSIDIVEADLDYAEVWIAVGQYVDPSNISKFRDPVTGKPVNLGSNGQTPTGTSPTYYLKGPWQNFATNLGTGGAVTLVNVPASGGGFTAVAAIGDSTWVLTE